MIARGIVLRAPLLVLLCPSIWAQQPFYTDDADVTEHGKLHLEFANQFSWLHKDSFPNLRQNAAIIQLNYGLGERLEIGFDFPSLAIFNAPVVTPQTPIGFGDTNFTVKWNLRRERLSSAWPALAISFAVETPTGDAATQLGSGVADYGFNTIVQKSLGERTTVRMNNGLILSGNTLTGAVGLRAQGLVYSGGASVTHQCSKAWLLGVEFNGAAAQDADLGKGAVQVQLGGKYAVGKSMTVDFGLLRGWFVGSSRLGMQMGLSLDF